MRLPQYVHPLDAARALAEAEGRASGAPSIVDNTFSEEKSTNSGKNFYELSQKERARKFREGM